MGVHSQAPWWSNMSKRPLDQCLLGVQNKTKKNNTGNVPGVLPLPLLTFFLCISLWLQQEEAEKQESGPFVGLFGRAKKAVAAEEDEEAEQPQPRGSSLFAALLGGTRKVRAEEAAAQPAKQAKRAASAVGSGGKRAAATAKSAAEPGKKPSGGLFGRSKAAAAAQGLPITPHIDFAHCLCTCW